MQNLQKEAYATASAYGVAADEFLQSVAAFSRAGYRELSSDLAEIAVKTQIVGDTTQEIANQFLLSVDAAYKFNGEISELNKVLDGANEIDNKYATSIEKIAEGLGSVAPIAAQAGIGVNELTAAIGTITAVTQRSGNEAAKAFRALILNIIGDTETLFEDESGEMVRITQDQVQKMSDVIKIYAKDAYEAAEATGSIINPMEAIAGLAQSVEDGLITEQKLMSIVSDIGGKMRSSQLLALVREFDMYESMLVDYANAVGSADREVSNALDSWARKTEILKNTFSEFVSDTIDTKWIKNLIDGVTSLIKLFNNLGTVLILLSGIIASALLPKIIKFAVSAGNMIVIAANLPKILIGMAMGSQAASSAFTLLGKSTVVAQAALGSLTLVVTAIVLAFNAYNQKQEETRQAALDLAESNATLIKSIYEAKKSIEDENSSREDIISTIGTVNSKYAEELESIQDVNDVRKKAIELLDEEARARARETKRELGAQYAEAVERQNKPIGGITSQFQSIGEIYIEASAKTKTYAEAVEYLGGIIDKFNEKRDSGEELSKTEEKMLDRAIELYSEFKDVIEEDTKVIKRYTDANDVLYDKVKDVNEVIEETNNNIANNNFATNLSKSFEELNESLDKIQNSYSTLYDVVDEYNKNGKLSIDMLQRLVSLDAEYLAALQIENGQIIINKKVLSEYVEDLKISAIQKLSDAAASDILTYATGRTSEMSDTAKTAVANLGIDIGETGNKAITATGQMLSFASSVRETYAAMGGQAIDTDSFRAVADAIISEYAKIGQKISGLGIDFGKSSVTGSSSSPTKKSAKETKDIWKAAFDEQYKMLQHQLKMNEITELEYTDKLEALYKKYFQNRKEYLDDFNKYEEEVYSKRKSIFDDEVNDIEHIIEILQKRQGTEEQQISFYVQLQEKIRAKILEYQKAGLSDNHEYIQELEKQWWDYSDSIKDIYESLHEKEIEQQEKVVDSFANAVNVAIVNIDKEIKKLNEQKEAIQDAADEQIKALEEQKKALEDANDEKDRAIELEKLQQALEQARTQKNIRVYYEDLGFVWEANADAIKDAEDALDDFTTQEQIRKLQEQIDKIKEDTEAQIAGVDAQIKKWEEIKEQLSSVTENYQNQANEQRAIMEGFAQFEQDVLNQRLDSVKSFVEQYMSEMRKLDTLKSVTTGSGGAITSGGKGYDPNKDYAKEALDALARGDYDAAQEALQNRTEKAEGEGLTLGQGKYPSNEEIWNKGTSGQTTSNSPNKGNSSNSVSKRKYDNGGLAGGKGVIIKDTNDYEAVLNPSITRKILTPQFNTAFTTFTESLERIFPIATMGKLGKSISNNGMSGQEKNINFFFDNVTIQSDNMEDFTSKMLSKASMSIKTTTPF